MSLVTKYGVARKVASSLQLDGDNDDHGDKVGISNAHYNEPQCLLKLQASEIELVGNR